MLEYTQSAFVPGGSGRLLGGFRGAPLRELFARTKVCNQSAVFCPGRLREASGRLLGGFWEASGKLLGGFWEASGKLLGASEDPRRPQEAPEGTREHSRHQLALFILINKINQILERAREPRTRI